MRKIFTLLFTIITIGFVNAQSFELRDTSGNLVSNQTINVTNPAGDIWNAFAGEVELVNLTATTKYVKCKRFIVTPLHQGIDNYFCWVSCYGPTVNVSPTADTVDAAEVVNKFHGYVSPNGIEGSGTIRYTFYDMNNVNDSVCITINFSISLTGINSYTKSGNIISDVFPNPSNGNAFVKINNVNSLVGKKTTLKIYNVLGKEVASQNITNATETIALNNSNLPSGVYFLSVYADNRSLTTKRFVIE